MFAIGTFSFMIAKENKNQFNPFAMAFENLFKKKMQFFLCNSSSLREDSRNKYDTFGNILFTVENIRALTYQ